MGRRLEMSLRQIPGWGGLQTPVRGWPS